MSQAIQRAAQLHQQGQLDEAETLYTAILSTQPGHFDALHLLGVLRFQRGRNAEALDLIRAALNLEPNAVAALSNIGLVHAKLNQPERALASYDKALAVKPDYAEALYNRGLALIALDRAEEALASCDKALALKPGYIEALYTRGNVLMNLKRPKEALASYDKVLAATPDFAEALGNRGLALIDLDRHEEALASCDKALAFRPNFAEGHYNRSIALVNLGRLREALASDDKALALKPDFAEAHCNRGVVLHALEHVADALTSFDEALAQKPGYAVALYNRGNALIDLQRSAEALASYDKALALKPDFAELLCNRGLALAELKRPQEALASYDRAIALKPRHAEARYGRSLCLLLQGDYVRGWREYEWRWESKRTLRDKRSFAQPLWLGDENLTGRTILLHFDQGYGDTIQFCRYAKLVACRGARVLLEVQPALRSLISSIDRSVRVTATGDALPEFDYHCPLMRLPLAFKTSLDTIPATCPYLFAAPENRHRWQERLGVSAKPRIGLVWAGNPRSGDAAANRMDRQRSVTFDQLAPLFESTHGDFYSLQKGDDAIAQLQDSVHRRRVADWTDDLHDFADTAALIENLDLIITVDTAVAHLAGALGKPFWLLNRFNTCWRWLLDREDSPWYPTARIFRQPSQGDWTSVIASVAIALRQWSDAFAGARPLRQPGAST